MMAYTSDEEEPSYYRNFGNEEVPPTVPSIPRPTHFGYNRQLSQPELNYPHRYGMEDVSRTSIRSLPVDALPSGGHRRGASDSQAYRSADFYASDNASIYTSAGQRRRAMHPELYHNEHAESRSSVLRTLFTPKPSEIVDLEQRHSPLYIMLHPKSEVWYAQIFKRFISTLIIADLLAFVISTDPQIMEQYHVIFRTIEGVTSCIFLVEYMARISICIENKKFEHFGPIFGRLRWMCTFHAVIDILATVPFFIFLGTGWNLPNLTYLRIFRVLRIMKTEAYSRAFSACYRVIYFNREILSVGILICLFLVVGSSVLLYYFRPRLEEDGDGLPFRSIPETLYLSVLILTGQDSFIRSSEAMPWYTKCVVGLTGALSVAMYAIPVSLLTWGFEAEAERCARKTRAGMKQAKFMGNEAEGAGQIEHIDSLNSDDEYLKIIAKETSSASSMEQKDKSAHKLREMTDRYLANDYDGEKFVALTAFLDQGCRQRPIPEMDESSHSTEIPILKQRLGDLQTNVNSINAKLDRLCGLLERKPNHEIL